MFGNIGQSAATAGSVLGIAQGLERGGTAGNIQAALGGASLLNRGGAFGGASSSVGGGLGLAGGAMGLLNGLNQGGVEGYGRAAAGGLRLASGAASLAGNSGLASSLGGAAGYVAAPLAIYDAVSNWQSGDTVNDTLRGAEAGAAIGSVVPVIGTAIGAIVGGAAGALSSAFGSGKAAQETGNWKQANAVYSKYGAEGVNAIGDKYLSLAGLFDSRKVDGNIPIYKQYGRMGEEKFTNDMADQLDAALKKGTITKSTDPTTAYNKVVQPWIDSFGKGAMSDKNAGTITALLQGMVGDYLTTGTSTWKARGGDNPFAKRKKT